MNDLLQTIKKAAVEAVEQTKPCTVLFGQVVSDAPLTVLVAPKLSLGVGQMTMLAGITLEVGDRVVLLSLKGGGRYVLFGKVVT